MATAPKAAHDGLVIDGVGHSFGAVSALQDVSLSVSAGEVHCLLGPSGSGKSTLLRLVAGLEALQRGEIQIGGVTVAGANQDLPPEKRSTGFVFQDYALFPHLDVAGNVSFGMAAETAAQKAQETTALLERIGMRAFANAMPHTLSGGQQQRIALARALAREPRVMLMDEPFSGLDSSLRDEVRGRTLEVLQQEGVATLLVTHSPEEALAVGDRISVLTGGRLLQTGDPEEIYGQPISTEVATIFGPINTLLGRADGTHIETPCGSVTQEAGTGDARVQVLVRPESLEVRPATADEGAPGQVRGVVHAGATVNLRVTLDTGEALLACELTPSRWQIGDAVRVLLRPDARITTLPSNDA